MSETVVTVDPNRNNNPNAPKPTAHPSTAGPLSWITFNVAYFQTVPGILKLIQLVSSVLRVYFVSCVSVCVWGVGKLTKNIWIGIISLYYNCFQWLFSFSALQKHLCNGFWILFCSFIHVIHDQSIFWILKCYDNSKFNRENNISINRCKENALLPFELSSQ